MSAWPRRHSPRPCARWFSSSRRGSRRSGSGHTLLCPYYPRSRSPHRLLTHAWTRHWRRAAKSSRASDAQFRYCGTSYGSRTSRSATSHLTRTVGSRRRWCFSWCLRPGWGRSYNGFLKSTGPCRCLRCRRGLPSRQVCFGFSYQSGAAKRSRVDRPRYRHSRAWSDLNGTSCTGRQRYCMWM